jgi:predicted nucleotidyltransferase
MDQPVAFDPILCRLSEAVRAVYRDRLDRLMLSGSRARGDHTPESDDDVAVFQRDLTSAWDETGVLAPILTDLLLSDDAFIVALPFPANDHDRNTGLMADIRREGVSL